MPQSVQHHGTFAQVREGDFLSTFGNDPITEVVRKPVWLTITRASGEVLRRRRTDPVTFYRDEPTEAERNDETLRYAQRRAASTFDEFVQRDYVQNLHEEIDKRADYQEIFDWSNTASMFKRQAYRKLGMELIYIAQKVLKIDDLRTDAECFEALAVWYAEEVLGSGSYKQRVSDPLSRSSAVLSSIFEDLDRWARAQLIEQIKWMGEPFTDRAKEIRAKFDEEVKNNTRL
jgi:hypothetical protein